MTAPDPLVYGLPSWVRDIRPHQADAVDQIVGYYEAGVKVVMLDGPTGTGKTLIAEMVRQRLATRGLYVCTDKGLQDQFVADFPYAKLIKGRANYSTLDGPADVTAEDCTLKGSECTWCSQPASCPYLVAKDAAASAQLAVANTSYLLAEANGPKPRFSAQPFIVADEADELERSLLGYVEFVVPQFVMRALPATVPKKGARKTTLIDWLEQVKVQSRDHLHTARGLDERQRRSWQRFIVACDRMVLELRRDIERAADVEDEGIWLRDYETGTFKMVPVRVTSWGARRLWRHGRRWLLMSATLISPEQLADELGLPFAFETVSVPMNFPVENRPIYLAGVASMTYRSTESDYDRMATAIEHIADRHPHDRILVHTVSYRLTRELERRLRPNIVGRPLITYDQASGKRAALAQYRRLAASILLAPSVTRGVDLSDDDCRVMIIAKVPFPSFGDKRVSARLHLPGGQLWYVVQTVRDIVQMTGRGVRSHDDYAATYILDRQFTSNTWKKGRHLFPQWWRDAVDTSFSPRDLIIASAQR